MSIWGIIFSRLQKHSLYHLFIPLAGGILVEFVLHELFSDESKIVTLLGGVFWFRTASLLLGVCLSWIAVMFLLIRHETNRKVDLRNLMRLEKRLNTARGYYGVSIIPLAEWFDPGSQLYLAKLLKRKLDADDFEHDRTLLFFSNRELKNTKVDLMDENYYGRCLAFMHGEFGIPLSFLARKEILEILQDEFEPAERSKLGGDPRWINWIPFDNLQRLCLNWLPRRIPQLDFALVTPQGGEPSVLRICKSEDQLRIKEELAGDDAKPYIKLAKIIKARVYDSDQRSLHPQHDFLAGFGSRVRRRQQKDPRRIKLEELAAKRDVKFRMKRYLRFVDIAEKSGDIAVREEFESVTAYPGNSIRERLPRTFISKFGYLREPEIIGAEGAQIGWEWDAQPAPPGEKRGFVTFDPPLESVPVRFVIERKTRNGIHFNQRDRHGPSEEVSGHIENLIDLYVLKVRFPKTNFPTQFQIHVTDAANQRDYAEEKLVLTRFARFALDSTAVLILERPLPGYTYRILWSLPKDDIDQMRLSRAEARIVREANRRLLTLHTDAERLRSVRGHLDELQKEVAKASIGPYVINDPGLEVALHAYSEEKGKLVMVAANGREDENAVEIGSSTVGQAYKRRALVNWTATSNSDDGDFWDYGAGHLGIVSIPLFFPLKTHIGGRVCVLSIATSSMASGFLNVIEELDDQEIRRAFTQHVNAWYAKSLAGALGLPDLSKGSLNRAPTQKEE